MKTMSRVAVAALASTAQAGFPTLYPDEKTTAETLCSKVDYDPNCETVICPYDMYIECLAKKMQVALCPKEVKLANAEDAKAMKAFVDSVAGDNSKLVTDTIANRSAIQDMLLKKAQDPNFLLGLQIAVAPLLMLLFSIIWFSFCCWSWCCCCRCCRCCSRERGPPRKRSRFIALLMYVAAVAWFLVAASLLGKGLSSTRTGGNDFQCGAASVVKVALSGTSQKNDVKFSGIMPLLTSVSELVGQLKPESEFLTRVDEIIDSTAPLERSVKSLTGLMATIGQILDASCPLCEDLSVNISAAGKSIDNSVSTSLAAARTQAKSQLQGDQLDRLRTTVDSSLDNFNERKNMIVSKVGMLLDGKVKDMWGHAETGFDGSLGVLLGLMLPVVLFGLFAMLLCLFKTENESAKAEGRNPYSPWAGRCAACGWCCGFFISFIAFLLAAMFGLLGFALALGCSVLMDFDEGTDLNDFLATLNTSSPLILDLFDHCLVEKGDGDLVNIVKYRVCPAERKKECIADLKEGNDATKCPLERPKECGDDVAEDLNLRQYLSETVKKPLDDAFDKVQQVGSQGTLATNQKIIDLTERFADAIIAIAAVGGNNNGTYMCDFQEMDNPQGGGPPYVECDQAREDENDKSEVCAVTVNGAIKYRIKEKTCDSFQHYQTNFGKFSTRLNNAVGEVDAQVLASKANIEKSLRDLVKDKVLDPLFGALDSLDCKPLGTAFWYLLNGLCYNMTPGFVHTAQALSLFGGNALFLMIVLYFVWRFVRDNINGWEKASRDA